MFNDSKVFPARLYGNKEKTGAEIEVFLLRELNPELRIWDVLVDPARKIRIGNKLYFGEDDSMVAEVIDNTTSRGRTLRFLFDGEYDEFKKELYALGETPLPRFINRKVEPEDAENYQTIFAKHEGAVAAPTAGMHFSRELMKRMEIKGIDFAYITLHVGLGNFREVDVEDLTKHKMDSEQIFVTPETVKIVNDAKDEKHKICAVEMCIRDRKTSITNKKGKRGGINGDLLLRFLDCAVIEALHEFNEISEIQQYDLSLIHICFYLLVFKEFITPTKLMYDDKVLIVIYPIIKNPSVVTHSVFPIIIT